MTAIRTIVHPTDFSEASAEAFAHALRIALAEKPTLTLLHVAEADEDSEWTKFPHVRETLARWGLMDEKAPADAIGQPRHPRRQDRPHPAFDRQRHPALSRAAIPPT